MMNKAVLVGFSSSSGRASSSSSSAAAAAAPASLGRHIVVFFSLEEMATSPSTTCAQGVVFMSSLYQHYQGKSLHNYVMMPQYDFLYTIFLREDPSTHHRCMSITPRIVLSYCIIIQGVYHKGAMTMSFFPSWFAYI